MNESDGTRTNWASFCVQGANLDFDAISRELKISPTHRHRAGDPSRLKNKRYPHDMWSLKSPLAHEEPLDTHLKWLANQLRPHYAYIESLKSPATDVYIFCAYTTEAEQNHFSLSSEALEICTATGISLDFSILAI